MNEGVLLADSSTFREFPKIPRLFREIVVTEKIDGTNGCVYVAEDGIIVTAQSRSQVVTQANDNFGFARWVEENAVELRHLGPGYHYGEWWGAGIQRRYGQQRKWFSLFNVSRWTDDRPPCCSVVPVLWRGIFDTAQIHDCLNDLRTNGSKVAPGFMKPEGIIAFHGQGNLLFKATLEKDEEWKGKSK